MGAEKTTLYAGVRYRYADATTGPTIVFTAGACPLDGSGTVVGAGDLAVQTGRTLTNLRASLETAGCRMEDVVKTTVFVASSRREDLLTAWAEYERVFGSHGPPSTLLGVAVLGYADQLVEIEAVAVRPE